MQYEVVTYLTFVCCPNASRWRWWLFIQCQQNCNRQYVCLFISLKLGGIINWCLLQYEVVISLSCAIQIHHNGDDGSSFVECIERCHVVRRRTASTFVLLRVQLNWMLCIGDWYSMMPSSAHPWSRVQIHYNVDDGSATIFLDWIYGNGAVLDKQGVRLYCSVCALEFEHIIFGVWTSKKSYVIRS